MKHWGRIYRVFPYEGCGGNLAAVLADGEMEDEERLVIAKRLGLSETAFLGHDEKGFRLRFFTPVREIEMCGHATLASMGWIRDRHVGIPAAVWVGDRKIPISSDGERLFIQMGGSRRIAAEFEPEALAGALGLSSQEIGLDALQPVIYDSGIPDILLPVRDLASLARIRPDREGLIALSRSYDVVGLHAFTIEKDQLHARNFAPLYGIDEEFATGTSNHGLITYLLQAWPGLPRFGGIIQGTGEEKGKVDYHIREQQVFIGGEVLREKDFTIDGEEKTK